MTRGNPNAVSAEPHTTKKVWAEWNTEKTCASGCAEDATNTLRGRKNVNDADKNIVNQKKLKWIFGI